MDQYITALFGDYKKIDKKLNTLIQEKVPI